MLIGRYGFRIDRRSGFGPLRETLRLIRRDKLAERASRYLSYHQESYGVIAVDWQANDPLIEMRVVGIGGEIAIQFSIRLSELQFANP